MLKRSLYAPYGSARARLLARKGYVQVFVKEHQRTEYKHEYSVQTTFLRPTDDHNDLRSVILLLLYFRPLGQSRSSNHWLAVPVFDNSFISCGTGSGELRCLRQQLHIMWYGERRVYVFTSTPPASLLPSWVNPLSAEADPGLSATLKPYRKTTFDNGEQQEKEHDRRYEMLSRLVRGSAPWGCGDSLIGPTCSLCRLQEQPFSTPFPLDPSGFSPGETALVNPPWTKRLVAMQFGTEYMVNERYRACFCVMQMREVEETT
ncbi:hypothetical protein M513_11735 [Trichuris suis]|uniref:Uncharacterized protein n=1 Tax=Trichuris suis TaxID=68888 RepID=A0A085LQX6_9BILA|nr:hypothetical protein M513_11735 [Trichuris suis]